MAAHEIDKIRGTEIFRKESPGAPPYPQKTLRAGLIAYGNEQNAAFGKLIQQGVRNFRPARRDDNAFKGRGRRQSQRAVTPYHINSAKGKLLQEVPCDVIQLGNPLYGVDAAPHDGEDRGLIARSRADFQHAHAGSRFQTLGHERDGGRLRNGLPVAYGQTDVFIGLHAQSLFDKEMPGHGAHSLKHCFVRNAGALILGGNDVF